MTIQCIGRRKKIIYLTLSTDEALRVGNHINHAISVPEKERISSSRYDHHTILYHTSFDLVEWIEIFMDLHLRCSHFHTLFLSHIRHWKYNRQNFHDIDLNNMLWLWLGVNMSKHHNALLDRTYIGIQRISIFVSLYRQYDIGGIAIIFSQRYGVWVLIDNSDSLLDAIVFGKNITWKESPLTLFYLRLRTAKP